MNISDFQLVVFISNTKRGADTEPTVLSIHEFTEWNTSADVISAYDAMKDVMDSFNDVRMIDNGEFSALLVDTRLAGNRYMIGDRLHKPSQPIISR